MSEFTVPVAELVRAALANSEIADGVRRVDLSGPSGVVAAALPGGRAAEAARQAQLAWAAALTSTAGAIGRHAGALDGCARSYQDTDAAAAHSLDAITASGTGAR